MNQTKSENTNTFTVWSSKCLICILLILSNTLYLKANNIQETSQDGSTYLNSISDISPVDLQHINLPNKTIPLSNPVYQLIDYYETLGKLGILPLSRPYRKISIIQLLNQILEEGEISDKEKKIVEQNLADLLRDSNAFEFLKQTSDNGFLMVGSGVESNSRVGLGDHGSWSTSNLVGPFFAGDLGEHLTFAVDIKVGMEQLTPDMFYQSYTNDGTVHFPFEEFGYTWMPYQFQFATNYTHYSHGWSSPFKQNFQLALRNSFEFTASFLNGSLELSANNSNRSWGHKEKNLLLSSTARSFPAFEMRIKPVSWFRYSYSIGSLFWLPTEANAYRADVYGVDLGRYQKMITTHIFELLPFRWIQLTAANNVIWSKRMELSYLAPLIIPSLVQDNIGDQDNPALYFDVATQFKNFGKAWLGVYLDDVSIEGWSNVLREVKNKYAWQVGWRTNLLSSLIPGTTSTLDYTRVTPFVYTHYPESDFSMGYNDRPIDMTYTHDGFNLGFYLPPNSAELSWSLVNIAIPNLVLYWDNRFIIHGTNDLSSENFYQIYGDIYQDHKGDLNNYPLFDFTKDGIYDFSFQSEFKFDWKIRTKNIPSFYRLTGSLGYSDTWWKANNSGVTAPLSMKLITASLGIIVEI